MQVLNGFLVVHSILHSEEKQAKCVDFFPPTFIFECRLRVVIKEKYIHIAGIKICFDCKDPKQKYFIMKHALDGNLINSYYRRSECWFMVVFWYTVGEIHSSFP